MGECEKVLALLLESRANTNIRGKESGCLEPDWRGGGERERWIDDAAQWLDALAQDRLRPDAPSCSARAPPANSSGEVIFFWFRI